VSFEPRVVGWVDGEGDSSQIWDNMFSVWRFAFHSSNEMTSRARSHHAYLYLSIYLSTHFASKKGMLFSTCPYSNLQLRL